MNITFWGTAFALTPEDQGLQIVQEVDRRDIGFGDSQSDLKMILRTVKVMKVYVF